MSATIELQSSRLLDASSGRSEFQIRMRRGWGGLQKYHVVGLQQGLLLLNIGSTVASAGQFDGTMGRVGGLLGGRFGRLFGNALEKACETPLGMADNNYSMLSDDELIEKAKGRDHKGSLVAMYDEINSISIDKRGMAAAWTRGGSVAALVTVNEQSLGKMTWEICDQQSLVSVIEFLPARLGDKVQCNIAFDPESLRIVPRQPSS